MEVTYQGKQIELEEPTQEDIDLDCASPINMYDDELDLLDTMEVTEEMINEINKKVGEVHE